MKFPLVDKILDGKLLVTYLSSDFKEYITGVYGTARHNGFAALGLVSFTYSTPNEGSNAQEQAQRAHISMKVYAQENNQIHPSLAIPR